MDFTDSTTTNPLSPSSDAQKDPFQVGQHVSSVAVDLEATCWGCGLHLTLPPYAPAFICGWCGAISNQKADKLDNKYFWLRRFQDRCFVSLILIFMLFMISGGFWAIYPVVFSVSYFCGVFNICIGIMLSITTLSMYCFAAFKSPGVPPIIPWGSYPVVGRGDLLNYTFCIYCSKPKSPRTHHCRSCRMCVLDMDHHCPFIGNCVGAANHRNFILFLISAVTSTVYVSVISAYGATKTWPPLHLRPSIVNGFRVARIDLALVTLKEIIFAFVSSALFLSLRTVVLTYLFIASVAVEIGLCVLLWQQLCYIYEGKTYLSHLKSQRIGDEVNHGVGEKDFINIIRFFDCPSSFSRFLQNFWSTEKRHKK